MKGKTKTLPQYVESFDESEMAPIQTYRVEFHRNTSGLCYYGIEVGGESIDEMKKKLNAAIDAVQEVIKKRGWKEVGS